MQDIERQATQEYANIVCHVAFYLHFDSPIPSKSIALQPIRSDSTTVPTNDTPLRLLCRVSGSRKLEFGIQFNWLLPVRFQVSSYCPS